MITFYYVEYRRPTDVNWIRSMFYVDTFAKATEKAKRFMREPWCKEVRVVRKVVTETVVECDVYQG